MTKVTFTIGQGFTESVRKESEKLLDKVYDHDAKQAKKDTRTSLAVLGGIAAIFITPSLLVAWKAFRHGKDATETSDKKPAKARPTKVEG